MKKQYKEVIYSCDYCDFSSNDPKVVGTHEYQCEHNPAELYVMDLATTPEGIKIVEYNCWNASGFYHSNIRDIIFQVNEIKGLE